MPIIEPNSAPADTPESRFLAAQSRPYNPTGDPTEKTFSTDSAAGSDPAGSANNLLHAHQRRSTLLGAIAGKLGDMSETAGSRDQGERNPHFDPYSLLSDKFIEQHPYMQDEFESGSVLDIPNEDAFWRYVRNKGEDAKDRETMNMHGFGANLAIGLIAQAPEIIMSGGLGSAADVPVLANLTRSSFAAKVAVGATEAAAVNLAQEETIRALAPTKRNLDEQEAALMALGMGTAFGAGMPMLFKGAGSLVSKADRNMLARFQNDMGKAMNGEKHDSVMSAAAADEARAAQLASTGEAGGAITILRTAKNAAHLAELEKRGYQIMEHPRQADYDMAVKMDEADSMFEAGAMGEGGALDLLAADATKQAKDRIASAISEVSKTVNDAQPAATSSKGATALAKLASVVTPGGRLRATPSAMARKVSNLLFENSWATAESAANPLTHQVHPSAESLKWNLDSKFNDAQLAIRDAHKAGAKAGGFTHSLANGETLTIKSTGQTRDFGRAVVDHMWREDMHARGQGEAPQSHSSVMHAANAARQYFDFMDMERQSLGLMGTLKRYLPQRWKAWEVARNREDFVARLIEQENRNYQRDYHTGEWLTPAKRMVDEGVWTGKTSHLNADDLAKLEARRTAGERLAGEATARRKQAAEAVKEAKGIRKDAHDLRDQAAAQLAEARRFRSEAESLRSAGNKAEATAMWKKWEGLRDQAALLKAEARTALAKAKTRIADAAARRREAVGLAKEADKFPKEIRESELHGILSADGMGRYDQELKAFWRGRAEATFKTLTTEGNRFGAKDITHGSSPMKERSLEIDPAYFREYLHDDLDSLSHGYHHSTAGQLASRRAFINDGDMQASVKSLTGKDPAAEDFDPYLMLEASNNHFQILIDWARTKGNVKMIDRLENAKKSASADLLAKLNELHGASMEQKPIGWALLVQRVSLRMPVMSYLGNLVASNISDIASVALTSKMTLHQKWQMAKALIVFKEMPRSGLESLYVGTMDAANSLRAARGMELTDMPMGREYGAGRKARVMEAIDKVTEKGTAKFLELTGMPRFNGNLRRAMGSVVMDQFTKGAKLMARAEQLRLGGMAEAEAIAKVGLSPEDATLLNRLGINGKTSTKLIEHLRKHGTDWEGKALSDFDTHEGFVHPQIEKWAASDRKTADIFTTAINSHTLDLILEPKLLSKPLMNQTWIGKVFNQMANFFYAWGNQQAVLAAQRPITSQAQYMMLAVGLGGVADAIHNSISGRRSLDETAQQWMDNPVAMTYGAIDRSALLGWLARPIAVADKYNLGPNRFVKNENLSGTFSRADGPWEILGGPFASWAKSLSSGVGGIVNGNLGDAQKKQIWNATPYHNLWLISAGLRAMEAAGVDTPTFTRPYKK